MSWPRPRPLVGDATSAGERAAEPRAWHMGAARAEALYQVMSARRDIRRFRPDAVDEATLGRLLAAAHAAPSVGHSQPWRFIIVASAATRERAALMAGRERQRQAALLGLDARRRMMDLKLDGISDAPLGIVVCCDRRVAPAGVLGRATFTDADLWSCACAIENLWLAARAEGLGVGWVTLFPPGELAELVGLPDGVTTLGWLCLGWPDERPPGPGLESAGWSVRLPLADVVHCERWPQAPQAPPRPPVSHLRAPAPEHVVGARDAADRLLSPLGSLGVLGGYLDRLAAAGRERAAAGRERAVGGRERAVGGRELGAEGRDRGAGGPELGAGGPDLAARRNRGAVGPELGAGGPDLAARRNRGAVGPELGAGGPDLAARRNRGAAGRDRGAGGPDLAAGGTLVLVGADHPVASLGVSAYPVAVTGQVLRATVAGQSMGAAAAAAAHLGVVAVDAGTWGGPVPGALPIAPAGPRGDLAHADALSAGDVDALVAGGHRLGRRLAETNDLVALGEVGVGNTTVAAAMCSALLGLPAEDCVGLGAGADSAVLARKLDVVRASVARCTDGRGPRPSPRDVLAAVGGPELAVLAGVVLGAAATGAVVVLDGLATSVAALCAVRLEPGAAAYLVAGQHSRERAHGAVLAELGLEPLLDLRLRCGEGVGAVLAIGLLRAGAGARAGTARVDQ